MANDTKEVMQKRIGVLENLIKIRLDENKEMRDEFAKAFGWKTPEVSDRMMHSTATEYETPSWEQIFVEIGKLKNISDRVDRLFDFDKRVINIEQFMERQARRTKKIIEE